MEKNNAENKDTENPPFFNTITIDSWERWGKGCLGFPYQEVNLQKGLWFLPKDLTNMILRYKHEEQHSHFYLQQFMNCYALLFYEVANLNPECKELEYIAHRFMNYVMPFKGLYTWRVKHWKNIVCKDLASISDQPMAILECPVPYKNQEMKFAWIRCANMDIKETQYLREVLINMQYYAKRVIIKPTDLE